MSARNIVTVSAPPTERPRRRGVRAVPLFAAAGALLLASAGPPADAGSDPLAADHAAAEAIPEPAPARGDAPAAERTAAFGQGQDSPVKLIWFTMTNCGPCQTIRPYVERMHAEGLPIFKVDLNSRPDLAQRFGVNSAPTFVLEVNGQEEWRSSGVPGGDGMGVAQRLRSRLAAAMTANDAQLARRDRTRQPQAERLPETPRTPVEPSDVPLTLASAGDSPERDERGGFFDFFKRKPADDGPKTIDDPFAAADPGPAADPADAAFAAGDAAFADAAPAAGAGASGDVPPVSPTRDPMKTVVRIQVFRESGLNHGSGTIIASRPGRAIVLTCGHLFRDYQPGGRIEAETFADGTPRSWPATLIDFDEKSEVGLLSIACPELLPASALAPAGIRPGERVVSVGCDGGDDPTRQNHLVQRVPACVGPMCFSCTGQPMPGRSGGGCFDAAGRLVGVVWSRVENPPEGLYSAIEPIEALLDKNGLTALKAPAATPAAAPSPGAVAGQPQFAGAGAVDAEDGFAADDPAADELFDALFEESDPAGAASPSRTASADPDFGPSGRPAATPESSAAVADALGASGGAEITCIIRPLGPQGGPTRIVVINKATSRTLALLQGDAAGGAIETSLYQPVPDAPAAPAAPPRLGNGIARTRGDAPRSFCRPVVCRPRRVRR